MNRTALIKYLQANGCEFLREGSRHSIWLNPITQRQAGVPRHNEIVAKTAREICKQLDVKPPKFA